MENFEETKPEGITPIQTEEIEVQPLIITEDIRSYVYETAKWTKFLSIVGFIFSGFTVIFAFGASAMLSSMGAAMGPAAGMLGALGGGFITVIYLLIALMYFYPSLLMFKYSGAAKKAILFADQASLSVAMSKMKSIFKFWGILTIVLLALYLIVILFAVVIGAGAAMGS